MKLQIYELYEKEKISKYFKQLEKKNISKNEEKKVKKYLKKLEEGLEENLNKHKKHHDHDHDDPDYEGIRDIENLFGEFNEDQYKLVRTKSAFNNNCVEYVSRGDKNKNLSVKEYLFMIMLYLRDLINNHKAPIKLKYPGKIGLENGKFS